MSRASRSREATRAATYGLAAVAAIASTARSGDYRVFRGKNRQTNKTRVEHRGIQITRLMVALFFWQLYRKTYLKVGVVVRKVVQTRLERFHAGGERWGTVGLSDGRAKVV